MTEEEKEPGPTLLVPCFDKHHAGCGGVGCECDCHKSKEQ